MTTLMSEAVPPTSEPRSRRPFFWVLTLFFAPLLLAFLVYYGFGWRPSGMTNNGELISPAIPLPQVALVMPDGALTDPQLLQHKWTLTYVGSGACAQSCRDSLLTTRQLRLLLGKDMPRVQRLFLYSGECCDAEYFAKEQQGLVMASVDTAAGQNVLKLFPSYDATFALQAERIYIIDPLGNLMMSYPTHADARGVLTDLKTLLSLSHIG